MLGKLPTMELHHQPPNAFILSVIIVLLLVGVIFSLKITDNAGITMIEYTVIPLVCLENWCRIPADKKKNLRMFRSLVKKI